MVWAPKRTGDFTWLVNKDHAAMSANIEENADLAIAVASQQKRLAQKLNWFDVTWSWQIMLKCQRCPLPIEQLVRFLVERLRIDVMCVG